MLSSTTIYGCSRWPPERQFSALWCECFGRWSLPCRVPSPGLASDGFEKNLACNFIKGYLHRGGLCFNGEHDGRAGLLHEGVGWLHHCRDLQQVGGAEGGHGDGELPLPPGRWRWISSLCPCSCGGVGGTVFFPQRQEQDWSKRWWISSTTCRSWTTSRQTGELDGEDGDELGRGAGACESANFQDQPSFAGPVCPGAQSDPCREGEGKVQPIPFLGSECGCLCFSCRCSRRELARNGETDGSVSCKRQEPASRTCIAESSCEKGESGFCPFRERGRFRRRTRIWVSRGCCWPSYCGRRPSQIDRAGLVTLLSADKLKKATTSKVDLALENLGGATLAPTARQDLLAAARRALRVALQEAPEEISAVVEKLMLEDLTLQTVMPGMPRQDFSARAWVEHRSRIGAYKSSAYLAWSASGILDDLVNGRVAHARAKTCLMLVMIDQVAIDRGNWALGAELMLEQGPPLSALASHTLPSIADGESPFSRILDSRWAEVMLAHLKDAEDYVQKRKAIGKKSAEDGDKEASKPRPKPKAKSKGQAETCIDDEAAAVGPSDSRGDVDTKMVSIPGSRAPTIYVPAFVNSWRRVVSKYGGKLATSVKSFLSNKPWSCDGDHSLRALWPIPPPYPEVFGGDCAFGSLWRNCFWAGCSLADLAHVLVLCGRAGDFLHGNGVVCAFWSTSVKIRSHADLMARSGLRAESSADQLDALHRAMTSLRSTPFAPYEPDSCSVTRAEREKHGDDGCAAGLYGEFEGECTAVDGVIAQPIHADRLQFVGTPCFNPVPFFDKITAYAYENPLECVRDDVDEPPPKVSIHGSAVERNLLFRKMAECGRLVPLGKHEVRDNLPCGLFAVPKDLSRDRLILDARPPNTVEKALNAWTQTMSNATCLPSIELDDDQCLIMSGRDIRDYFYQFTVSAQRCRRNYLAGLLQPEDLEYIFDRKFFEPGYVGLSTLAMGDLNACEFAQGSHVQLILSCGGAARGELLMMPEPVPRGLLSIGVVIDDLVCLEKVLRIDFRDGVYCRRSQLDDRMSLIMNKYAEVGLPTNEKKAFDNSTKSSFWGVQVDGEKGLVRANESRLWPLLLITMRVCSLGLATVGLLRSLAGSYTSVLSLRRRLLSSMNFIFDAIAASEYDSQVLRLSRTLLTSSSRWWFSARWLQWISEQRHWEHFVPLMLQTGAWLLLLLRYLFASPRKFCVWQSLSKSCWAKLLPPSKAWLRSKQLLPEDEELPGDEQFDVHPFWEGLARSIAYKELWRKMHPKPIHVNVGELWSRDERPPKPSTLSCCEVFLWCWVLIFMEVMDTGLRSWIERMDLREMQTLILLTALCLGGGTPSVLVTLLPWMTGLSEPRRVWCPLSNMKLLRRRRRKWLTSGAALLSEPQRGWEGEPRILRLKWMRAVPLFTLQQSRSWRATPWSSSTMGRTLMALTNLELWIFTAAEVELLELWWRVAARGCSLLSSTVVRVKTFCSWRIEPTFSSSSSSKRLSWLGQQWFASLSPELWLLQSVICNTPEGSLALTKACEKRCEKGMRWLTLVLKFTAALRMFAKRTMTMRSTTGRRTLILRICGAKGSTESIETPAAKMFSEQTTAGSGRDGESEPGWQPRSPSWKACECSALAPEDINSFEVNILLCESPGLWWLSPIQGASAGWSLVLLWKPADGVLAKMESSTLATVPNAGASALVRRDILALEEPWSKGAFLLKMLLFKHGLRWGLEINSGTSSTFGAAAEWGLNLLIFSWRCRYSWRMPYDGMAIMNSTMVGPFSTTDTWSWSP